MKSSSCLELLKLVLLLELFTCGSSKFSSCEQIFKQVVLSVFLLGVPTEALGEYLLEWIILSVFLFSFGLAPFLSLFLCLGTYYIKICYIIIFKHMKKSHQNPSKL